MALQNKKSYHHGMKGLCKQRMIATEHFRQFYHIVITLSHFLTADGDHVVVHPVFHRRMMIADGALCYLTFMMWKLQIHSAAMNIKFSPQIFCCHRRAFNMPAGEPFAPGACPAHDVFRRCRFP